jgi:hypothetical protein
MENITMKISFLDKIKDKIEETITSYYKEPNQFTELEINKLYNHLNNSDFNDDESSSSSDDDDDTNFNFDGIYNFISYDEENPSETAIDFYNNFLNNNINNDMINRYTDKNYLKLYKNYKMNF